MVLTAEAHVEWFDIYQRMAVEGISWMAARSFPEAVGHVSQPYIQAFWTLAFILSTLAGVVVRGPSFVSSLRQILRVQAAVLGRAASTGHLLMHIWPFILRKR